MKNKGQAVVFVVVVCIFNYFLEMNIEEELKGNQRR